MYRRWELYALHHGTTDYNPIQCSLRTCRRKVEEKKRKEKRQSWKYALASLSLPQKQARYNQSITKHHTTGATQQIFQCMCPISIICWLDVWKTDRRKEISKHASFLSAVICNQREEAFLQEGGYSRLPCDDLAGRNFDAVWEGQCCRSPYIGLWWQYWYSSLPLQCFCWGDGR